MRIPLGYIDLFGVVSQVGAGAAPERLQESQPYGNRWVTVQLVGEAAGQGRFERGISQYPTIDDEVHLVISRDLARIYGRPEKGQFVPVGHLASAESIPALVDINRLVTRHSAVLGATGAGKSTTVAGLLATLSGPRYPSARIVIFDIHGEYARALSPYATVFRTVPDLDRGERPLRVPYWALTFEELLPLTLGSLDDAARAALLDKITAAKRAALEKYPREGVTGDNLTVDSPVPFSIRQVWFDLHKQEHATYVVDASRPRSEWAPALQDAAGAEGDAQKVRPPLYRPIKNVSGDPEKIQHGDNPLNIRRPLASLASRVRDPRFGFLFAPGEWAPDLDGRVTEDLSSLLEEWIGGTRPISILDLSGIPHTVLNDLLGALLRILYDALFWARHLAEGGRERPLLLVLEEAHAYVGPGQTGAAGQAVRRIAKEGRKYGIGLMLVSQRPSEIDATILSQCGTLFAMRMANAQDRAHVSTGATENLEGLFDMLPVLRTGEAIIVGEAVNLPIRTLLARPAKDRRPESDDPNVFAAERPDGGFDAPGGWNQRRGPSDYTDVIRLWRSQNHRSSRIVDTVTETGVSVGQGTDEP